MAGSGKRSARSGKVTDNTLGIMTPLTVTGKTLAVIGAFQRRLPEVFRVLFTAVAFGARGDVTRRAVMVTGLATLTHLSHISMKFVVEINRLIQVAQLADKKRVRSL